MTHDLFGPTDDFPPSTAAARARAAQVQPGAYARTRNALDGAVTRLSPYLTHGYLTLDEALAAALRRGDLPLDHKLIYEFAWRLYFHHSWQQRGAAIFKSLHDGVLPEAAYTRVLPADVREGRTGLAVIDRAVAELYATGYLHNHARMWLASYVVHQRKVHWRAGADWLYTHLLDGDLASNHLSWQWVASTGSHKPYLFNAENVARYAPRSWQVPGSVLDTDYDTLDARARNARWRAEPSTHGAQGVVEPVARRQPPTGRFHAPNAADVAGRDVWLVQPWALGDALNAQAPAGAVKVGWLLPEFHEAWPWNARRWAFVQAGLDAQCETWWWGSAADGLAALRQARSVHGWADPHTAAHLKVLGLRAKPVWWTEPNQLCNSFTQYWSRVTKGLGHSARALLQSA